VTETAIKKLYVDKDGVVTFVCPKCSESQRESVAQYKDQTGNIKVECKCSNVYEVQLEFRKSFRKETFLDGLYYRASHPGDWGKMTIRDLSLGGCRFETSKAHLLDLGEEIKLEFVLDDPRRSNIRKKAVVSAIEGRLVGCKFSDPPGSIDSELGFYMRRR
jgi:hypothetical protein